MPINSKTPYIHSIISLFTLTKAKKCAIFFTYLVYINKENMTGSQRNSLEKMREKFQEAQIPEIKASSLKAWDNGIRIRKDADDRARGISAFKSPSKNIGASEIIQVTDKTGRSYRFELTATPKGWSFGGYTIDLYTNFLQNMELGNSLDLKWNEH